MARLIDADDVAENLMNSNWFDCDDIYVALQAVKLTDTIDPESLRLKAHWIYAGGIDEDGNLVCWCSRCEHGDRHSPKITVPYCWFCGAKMEG